MQEGRERTRSLGDGTGGGDEAEMHQEVQRLEQYNLKRAVHSTKHSSTKRHIYVETSYEGVQAVEVGPESGLIEREVRNLESLIDRN